MEWSGADCVMGGFEMIERSKVSYGGYVIWICSCPDYVIYDIEKPGYDYAVATLNTMDEAKAWIDTHPNGDAVVDDIESEKRMRERMMLIDILCG